MDVIEARCMIFNTLIRHYGNSLPIYRMVRMSITIATYFNESNDDPQTQSMRISDLGLGTRVENSLTMNGIKSVSQLIQLNEYELRLLDGIGNAALHRIKAALDLHGISHLFGGEKGTR